jgi:hypothetical protein
MGRRLYFPSEEVVLRTFIVHKNTSLSSGFEPANPGSNGKHNNHQTTENDTGRLTFLSPLRETSQLLVIKQQVKSLLKLDSLLSPVPRAQQRTTLWRSVVCLFVREAWAISDLETSRGIVGEYQRYGSSMFFQNFGTVHVSPYVATQRTTMNIFTAMRTSDPMVRENLWIVIFIMYLMKV